MRLPSIRNNPSSPDTVASSDITNTPANTIAMSSKSPDHKGLVVGALVLLLLALGAGAYFYWHNSNSSGQKIFELPGKDSAAAEGMSFNWPDDFDVVDNNNPATKYTAASLIDYYDSTKTSATASIIASTSINDTLFKTKTSQIKTILAQPTAHTKEYLQFTHMLEQYVVNAAYPHSYGMLTTYLKSFTNPNISQNAWQADFIVLNADNSKANNKARQIAAGKVFLAFGKKSYYIFSESSITSNWQKNTALWQQELDSIKIDQ